MKQNSSSDSPNKTKLMMTPRRWRIESNLLKLAIPVWALLALLFFLSIAFARPMRDLSPSEQYQRGLIIYAYAACFFPITFGAYYLEVRRQNYVRNVLMRSDKASLEMLIDILDEGASILWTPEKSSYTYYSICNFAHRSLINLLPQLEEQDISKLSVRQRRVFYGLMELDEANLVVPMMWNAPQFGNADTLRFIKKMLDAKNFQTKYPTICAASQTAADLLEEKLALRNSPRTLLRASAQPAASPGELLRPAENRPDTRPQQLLRPASNTDADTF